MTREEFDKECSSISTWYHESSVTDDMYSLIKFVYDHYPARNLKDSLDINLVCTIYVYLGISPFIDMFKRSCSSYYLEHDLQRIKEQLKEVNKEKMELSKVTRDAFNSFMEENASVLVDSSLYAKEIRSEE